MDDLFISKFYPISSGTRHYTNILNTEVVKLIEFFEKYLSGFVKIYNNVNGYKILLKDNIDADHFSYINKIYKIIKKYFVYGNIVDYNEIQKLNYLALAIVNSNSYGSNIYVRKILISFLNKFYFIYNKILYSVSGENFYYYRHDDYFGTDDDSQFEKEDIDYRYDDESDYHSQFEKEEKGNVHSDARHNILLQELIDLIKNFKTEISDYIDSVILMVKNEVLKITKILRFIYSNIEKNLVEKYDYMIPSYVLENKIFKIIGSKKIPFFSIYTWLANSVSNIVDIVVAHIIKEEFSSGLKVKEKHKKIEYSGVLTEEEYNVIQEYGGPDWKKQLYYIEYELMQNEVIILFRQFLQSLQLNFKDFYIKYIKKNFVYFQRIISLLRSIIMNNNQIFLSRIISDNVEESVKRAELFIDAYGKLHNLLTWSTHRINDLLFSYSDKKLKMFKFDLFVDFIAIQQRGIAILEGALFYNQDKILRLLDIDELKKNIDKFKKITEDNIDISRDSDHYKTIKYLSSAILLLDLDYKLENVQIEKKDKVLFTLDENIIYRNISLQFKVLNDKDPMHFLIGAYTNCCQRIGGQGEGAALDSFINKYAGVLVLYNNNNIISQSYFHYVPEDNGIILDNVEENKKNRKILELSTDDLSEIYAYYAKLISQKYGFNYVKSGMGYNKINNSFFDKSSLEEDPRRFATKKYTDFNNKEHLNLINYRYDIDYDKFSNSDNIIIEDKKNKTEEIVEKFKKFKNKKYKLKNPYLPFRKALLRYLLLIRKQG